MSGHRRGEPYEVGYGRPPKATQFKRGQPSRNPRGRPKTVRHPFRDLAEVLVEKLTLPIDGEPVTFTRHQWALFALQRKAVTNLRAAKLLHKVTADMATSRGDQPVDYTHAMNRFLKLVDANFKPENVPEKYRHLMKKDD